MYKTFSCDRRLVKFLVHQLQICIAFEGVTFYTTTEVGIYTVQAVLHFHAVLTVWTRLAVKMHTRTAKAHISIKTKSLAVSDLLAVTDLSGMLRSCEKNDCVIVLLI